MNKYRIEKAEAIMHIEEYLEKYVDVETFFKYCEKCHNFNKKWSCPPYSFDVMDYWKQFKQLKIISRRILFDENCQDIDSIIEKEKDYLTLDLWSEETKIKGSVSLSAGCCVECGADNCAKALGDKCRKPERMRYSIESLGGNVGKTCTDIFGYKLEWVEENIQPKQFVLIGGLLY